MLLRLFVAFVVWMASLQVHATTNPSVIAGTIKIDFQPMQSAGAKNGCSLIYDAVISDNVYQQGELTLLSGNITYMISAKGGLSTLGLKIGLMNTLNPNTRIEPPFFAYIQSLNGTTSKSKSISNDSDIPGFRLFDFQIDENSARVIDDILNGLPIEIGFNRKQGGLDVLVPLDLLVAESTISDSGLEHRKSNEMISKFRSCFVEVSQQLKVGK